MRQRRGHIKQGTFASVIRAYLMSPKFDALAHSTRSATATCSGWPRSGKRSAHTRLRSSVRPLCRRFSTGSADRPAQQKNARAAIKAVEKWAIVRDLLPYPITMGTEAPGGTGGFEPWTDEQVELAETLLPAAPLPRHYPGIEHRPARLRSGQDAMVGYRGIRWAPRHQRDPEEDRAGDLGSDDARADADDCGLGAPSDLHPAQGGQPTVHAGTALRPMDAWSGTHGPPSRRCGRRAACSTDCARPPW